MILFTKDITGRRALLFSLLFALCHGLLSAPFSGNVLNWITLVPATVAETVLILHAGPAAVLLPPALCVAASALLGTSASSVLFSLCFFGCALVLAFVMRHRVERIAAVVMLAATCLLFLAGRTLWDAAEAAVRVGASDLLSYIRAAVAEIQDSVSVAYYEVNESNRIAMERFGYKLPAISEADVRDAVARLFSLAPSVLALLLLIPSLLMTYGMQFVSYMRGNLRAFALETWPLRFSPLIAGLYVALIPAVLFWRDFGSPFFVAFYNIFIVLTPLLAFAEIITLPRFYAAYRRMAGSASIVIPIVITVSVFLLSPIYATVGFALLQAINILKAAIGSRPPREEA